ncbi:hypothetical protein PO909_012081 [Leuciscus waleckii]
MNFLLSLSVCLLWLTAGNHAKTVLQSPDDLMKNEDVSAVFTCSHNIQDYNRMLWYKQSRDTSGLTLMGYLSFDQENKEPGFGNKINLDGDAKKNGTLTIKKLTLNDSSVVNGSVQQSPSNLIKTERDSAELVCTHNITSYNIILWYKQTRGHELTLLGYIWNTNYYPEDHFKGKIRLNGDGTKTGSFKIEALALNDSAMYFCAASLHGVMCSRDTIQKALKAAEL